METTYLTLKKLKALHESINWLGYYTTPSNEKHEIRNDDKITVDPESTKLLNELGQLNLRRDEIINQLTK